LTLFVLPFIRGWSPLVEAFASHRFNLTHLLIPIPIWMRYNNHYPVKITAWDHTNGSAIMVGKDSGINSPEDFGGKQFAVPYWYSIHNIVSQKIMKAAGITPVIRPPKSVIISSCRRLPCRLHLRRRPLMAIA